MTSKKSPLNITTILLLFQHEHDIDITLFEMVRCEGVLSEVRVRITVSGSFWTDEIKAAVPT